jgi:hypothetical protein
MATISHGHNYVNNGSTLLFKSRSYFLPELARKFCKINLAFKRGSS